MDKWEMVRMTKVGVRSARECGKWEMVWMTEACGRWWERGRVGREEGCGREVERVRAKKAWRQ